MNADVIAALVYYATMILGLSARLQRRRFGRWHHVAFAACCLSLAIAVVLDPSTRHLVPASALMVLPFTRPRQSRIHDLVAVIGGVGFVFLLS